MSAHTPEPWVCEYNVYNDPVFFSRKLLIGTFIAAHSGEGDERAKANARRIVTCVNACAGKDDPEQFRKDAEKAFRLLGAFVTLHEYGGGSLGSDEADLARALLARVKGEK